MSAIMRESTFGFLMNYFSNGKYFPYPDQRPDFVIPTKFLSNGQKTPIEPPSRHDSDAATVVGEEELSATNSGDKQAQKVKREITPGSLEAGEVIEPPTTTTGTPVANDKAEDPNLVTWYGPDDPENPQNWSMRRKGVHTGLIQALTMAVYIGSAQYTASIPGVMEQFNVSQVVATLGLSLFVCFYGLGPMILSPLSEIPSIGRNPPYIIGLVLYVIFQVPTALAPNIGCLLVFRALAGFFGSPALATGGSSIQDIWDYGHLPYMIGLWAMGAVMGPVFGPTIGGFAAQAPGLGWKWPIWILLWQSGATLIILFFFLAETLEGTILSRRAQRLRKLTGNPNLYSEAERQQSKAKNVTVLLSDTLIRPFKLMMEPAILYLNLYIALLYSIFYLWFEAFPIVFGGIYGFNLGEQGLVFLSFIVQGVITYTAYAFYLKYRLGPKSMTPGGSEPEWRLELGYWVSPLIPISIFWFGWASRASVHWIVPIIGASFFFPGVYLLFQVTFMYLPFSYPQYAASIFAGNALFRSVMAAGFPLFGKAMFDRLGLGGGSSLLAGLTILMIPGLPILMKYGKRLRAMSKYSPATMTPTNTIDEKNEGFGGH